MAEQNTYFDLSDELETNIKQLYSEMAENMQTCVDQFARDLETLCSTTHFEPMVNLFDNTVEKLDTDVKDNAEGIFGEWISNQGCFHAAATDMEAGEDAVATANQLESDLQEAFDNFWGSNVWQRQAEITTDRPVVKDEDYDEWEKIVNDAFNKIEEEGEKQLQAIDSYAEDNPTYGLAKPAIEALYIPLKNAFDGFAKKAKEFKDENQTKTGTMQSNANDAVSTAEASAIDADSVTENYRMFENL